MIFQLILQVVFVLALVRIFEGALPYIWGGTVFFSIGMVLKLLNSDTDPTAKMTWLLIMLIMPVFGGILYLYIKSDFGHRLLKNRLNQIITDTKELIQQE